MRLIISRIICKVTGADLTMSWMLSKTPEYITSREWFPGKTMGYCQVVRHSTLTAVFAGSNPASSADCILHMDIVPPRCHLSQRGWLKGLQMSRMVFCMAQNNQTLCYGCEGMNRNSRGTLLLSCLITPLLRTFISAGQRIRLITGRSWVRTPECPFLHQMPSEPLSWMEKFLPDNWESKGLR